MTLVEDETVRRSLGLGFEDCRGQFLENRVAGSQIVWFFGAEIELRVDAEGRHAQRRPLTNRIKDIRRACFTAVGLGDEQRVAGAVIPVAPLREVGRVNIGGVDVDSRSGTGSRSL